jgi:hypothetical protein
MKDSESNVLRIEKDPEIALEETGDGKGIGTSDRFRRLG